MWLLNTVRGVQFTDSLRTEETKNNNKANKFTEETTVGGTVKLSDTVNAYTPSHEDNEPTAAHAPSHGCPPHGYTP